MDDYPEYLTCPVCGEEIVEWECCWSCGGEGGEHDCGEDCCNCLRPDINVPCEECDGNGRYPICPRLPHTDEQMDNYRRSAPREV